MTLLVLGFGPFGAIVDNPSARLARALDGRSAGPATLAGFEMPVSYQRCVQFTRARVVDLAPAFVLGIGVAANRTVAKVEEQAVNRVMPGRPDVDGRVPFGLGEGPDVVTSADAWLLANALGVEISPDAGRYVCNAWLYQAIRGRIRAGFLHVPPQGYDVDGLVEGLARFSTVLAERAAEVHDRGAARPRPAIGA